MEEMTISEFCHIHGACKEGREWALSLGIRSMRKLWERNDIKPEWRLWIATRPGVMMDKDLRLFYSWCVRQAWHLLIDDRSKNAVEVAERYAVGEATVEGLHDANEAARVAADTAWLRAGVSAMAARSASAAEATTRHVVLAPMWIDADIAKSQKLMEYSVNFERRER